jgi:hypothetical protein
MQKTSHTYVIRFPAHDPRAHDPHMHDFLEWKKRRRDNGTYVCDFATQHRGGDTSECDNEHPLEAHHKVVELAMLNEIDFALLEAEYPGISAQSVGAWIDSDDNLTLLCVTPWSPVLMADGSELPIADVRPGHEVITKDGSAQVVLGVSRNKYRGDIYTFGRTGLTPTHRLLTSGGWLSAAEIHGEIGMHGPDVIRVRRIEHEVAADVVGPIPVNVMDALGPFEWPADELFHHVPVLHDETAVRQRDPDVALRGDLTLPVRHGLVGAGKVVEPGHAARVGAVVSAGPLDARPDRPGLAALRAVDGDVAVAVRHSPAALRAALPGTTRVLLRQGFQDKEALFADGAFPLRQRRSLARGWWDSLGEIRRFSYTGWVHDLIVPHNKSYVSSGIVVHNCVAHHRGPSGVHTASFSDFGSEYFVRDLISRPEPK